MTTIKLSRKELYELVWSKPLMHLAQELGISDRGLGKTCTRLEIPLPGRGYWQREDKGEKEALPLPSALCPKQAYFRGFQEKSDPIVLAEADIAIKAREFEAKLTNQISVPKSIERYHPLVKKKLASLLKAPWDKGGLYRPNEGHTLDLACTKECASRAARIYHVLLQNFQKRGFTVTVSPGYSGNTWVECYAEKIKISMREKLKQVPFKPAKGVKPSNFDPKVTYKPSGILCLRIDDYSSDSRNHCIDTDHSLLEEQLNEFLVRLAKAAIHIKRKRAEQELWNKQWEERCKQEESLRQRAVLEKIRREDLEELVSNWIKAKQIRGFIDTIRPLALSSPYEDMSKDEWLVWASAYADILDPYGI